MRAQAEPAGRSCRSQIRQGGGGGAGGRGGAACGSRGRRGGHARAGAPRGRASLQARARAAGTPAAGAPAPQHIADLRPCYACNCLLQERQLPKRCRHVERCNIRKLHPADVLVAPPACERMQVACRWQPTTIASSAPTRGPGPRRQQLQASLHREAADTAERDALIAAAAAAAQARRDAETTARARARTELQAEATAGQLAQIAERTQRRCAPGAGTAARANLACWRRPSAYPCVCCTVEGAGEGRPGQAWRSYCRGRRRRCGNCWRPSSGELHTLLS